MIAGKGQNKSTAVSESTGAGRQAAAPNIHIVTC